MYKEQWKPILYSNKHEISSFGRVRSIDSVLVIKSRWGTDCNKKFKGKVLKPFFFGDYLGIRFKMGGGNYYIHRLVAEHFLSGDHKLHINHIDGDKTNNVLDNLEFVTASQNMWHSTHVLNHRKGQFGAGRVRIGC
jgi:hypothetical protein